MLEYRLYKAEIEQRIAALGDLRRRIVQDYTRARSEIEAPETTFAQGFIRDLDFAIRNLESAKRHVTDLIRVQETRRDEDEEQEQRRRTS